MPRTKVTPRLNTYAQKRDFKSTPEPPPSAAPKPAKKKATKGLRFCVQKHLASSLHYDLRLEHEGVLLSWAVPKGPSLNPADKRMAVRTEDHPLAYGDFEGVIPSGYGAGIVLLWDEGTWTCEQDDVDAALKKGELKFRLDGVKLKGSWVLVRTSRQRNGGPEQWLLIKHRDQWSGDVDVADVAPLSIKSFSDFPDVLAASKHPHAFDSQRPAKSGQAGKLFDEAVAGAAGTDGTSAAPKAPANGKSPAGKGKSGAPSRRSVRLPKSALTVGANAPKLSNQAKVLYPETGFTKGQLVDYYRRVAPLILPHLRGRAVTLKRWPDGVDGKSFFEKRCPSHRPDWVKTVDVTGRSAGQIGYCLIEDLSTLLWTANLAAIELHIPMALAEHPTRPTAMVFDLDPGPPAGLAEACEVALRVRRLLQAVGLESFIKTSGSKGLHMLVPLNMPNVTADEAKTFARSVAMTLEKDDPKGVIASMNRAARKGKVFIDWSQNDSAKTTVCVYSVRAKEKPWISTPVTWSAIEKGKPVSLLATDKLPSVDPMLDVLQLKQKLPAMT